MSDTPDMQVQLVSSHGMLAILEVLEGKCSRDIIMKLLQMINLVCPFLSLLCSVFLNTTFLACEGGSGFSGEFLPDWVSPLDHRLHTVY